MTTASARCVPRPELGTSGHHGAWEYQAFVLGGNALGLEPALRAESRDRLAAVLADGWEVMRSTAEPGTGDQAQRWCWRVVLRRPFRRGSA